ncbi:MAG TPA: Abi family protein, partial [Candidatus Cryptobacteroides sp.]|nr:Abi family protein [Candidatus Cryptobacteroides sp.]
AYQDFSQKFSPFYANTAYDHDVANMTQIGMMTTDRVGAIVFNAIERIEISLRTKLIYHLSLGYGPEWYLNPSLFDND